MFLIFILFSSTHTVFRVKSVCCETVSLHSGAVYTGVRSPVSLGRSVLPALVFHVPATCFRSAFPCCTCVTSQPQTFRPPVVRTRPAPGVCDIPAEEKRSQVQCIMQIRREDCVTIACAGFVGYFFSSFVFFFFRARVRACMCVLTYV